ncbi:UDP-3-O-(3-hydroxymyristoyl)glucosamine N-acyltransferase [Hoeflea sp. TYP-13]|uniref:UDP-3-O-(3-hydroxymyristoyl)glucosamine N-acyltransferase n=1 Tax=Hoeflea sp. TYP-13 TaxID=3230023 RepID=UPI0034C5EE6A
MEDCRFFPRHGGIKLSELAEAIGAELIDASASDSTVTGVAPLSRATAADLTYIASKKHADWLAELKAMAVICPPNLAQLVPAKCATLVASKPQIAFARAAQLLYPDAQKPQGYCVTERLSAQASIHPDAHLEDDDVVVEAGAVIGAGAQIGSGTAIGPGSVIGPGCRIGRNCVLSAGVTVQHALIGNNVVLHPGVRIGQDGFGYAPTETGLLKIVQIGRVIVQDNVEIGANTTIDRGALDDTVIGEGTKIDNLVQVGHNVRIGRFCVIVSQVGISGSVTIGDGVMLGGNVGVNGHLTIGNGAQIAGMSAVAGDVPPGARWGGIPARPMRAFLKDVAELNARAFGRKGKKKGTANE